MNPYAALLTGTSSPIFLPPRPLISTSCRGFPSLTLRRKSPRPGWCRLRTSCSLEHSDAVTDDSWQNVDAVSEPTLGNENFKFEVRGPFIPARTISFPKLSLTDQVFLLLAFIGCTACVAFTSFVVAAVPTLFAMRRAALSFSKLADTAHEELPSTMAAIRLSGMEISDLTLELSDLSQEIADGVNKSAQAVQAAEAGVRQIGSLARQQTMMVAGAAKKTSRAVGRATKTLLNIISGGEHDSVDEDSVSKDRIDN